MTRLAYRFGKVNVIRHDRPLTHDELFRVVPNVFSEDKHESRSDRYTYIPTITLMDNLQLEGFQLVTETQLVAPRRWEDQNNDLWTTYQRIQENLIKGGLAGRTATGRHARTRSVGGIDGDVKLNRALWVMAENMLQLAS